MALDDFSGNGQAGSGASAVLVLFMQPLEYLENGILVMRCDADAVVPDVKQRRNTVVVAPHLYPFQRLVVVFYRIGNEILEYLADAGGIPLLHHRKAAGAAQLDSMTGQERFQVFRHGINDRSEEHTSELQS